MSEQLLTASDLDRLLASPDRHILLHSLEGDIIGASPSVCAVLGYAQDEIVQLLFANIKAHTVRLSDVCVDHKDNSAPVIFQRRNGRRFAARVDSRVVRASLNREVKNVVQLELEILPDGNSVNTNVPQFDLQESADYLELLGREIQSPLTTIGLFFDGLQSENVRGLDPEKLTLAVAARQELSELADDVVDWFKIGVNILALDRQPFNIIDLLDEMARDVNHLCRQHKVTFSLCINAEQHELVFGDVKRVKQLLYRLIVKLSALIGSGRLSLAVTTHRADNSQHNVGFTLTAFRDEPAPESAADSADPNYDRTLGIIGKLIRIMGGNLKKSRRSAFETEYSFALQLPNVDMLDVAGNPRFLAGHKILLIDEEHHVLRDQLVQWGADVESFGAVASALDYLTQLERPAHYALTIYNQGLDGDDGLAGVQDANNTSPVLRIKPCRECVLDREGVSEVPHPPRVGLLGNAIATLLGERLPYPYSHNQRDRFVNLNAVKQRILFVDDVETIRLTYRAVLEKAGFDVDLAQNGIDAILACNQKSYAAVVIDIQMPLMDGLEAANHIRKSSNLNDETPILAVSGDTTNNTRLIAERVGIREILPKPVAADELVRRVRLLVEDDPNGVQQPGEEEPLHDLLLAGRRRYESHTHGVNTTNSLNRDLLNSLIADTSLETCKEMIDIFLEESKRSVQLIDRESQHKNWEKVMHEAHAIKSTSYTFGCEALYTISARLEAEIAGNEHLKCNQTVDEMAAVFSESYLALEDFFKQAQAPHNGNAP